MRPVYLMDRVPRTGAEAEALRRRVESNPNYRGVLVNTAGTAAMVVANFRGDADPGAIAVAAQSIRSRFESASLRVHVVGAAVLRVREASALRRAVLAVLALAGWVSMAAIFFLGARGAVATAAAALLAGCWSALFSAGLGSAPWSFYAIPVAALLAAVFAQCDRLGARLQLLLCAAIALPLGALGLALPRPPSAFALAAAAGAVLASTAAALLPLRPAATQRALAHRRGAAIAAAVLIAALPGLAFERSSFGLLGYAARYSIGTAARDARALQRLFPPPSSLVIRAEGDPGFVAEPEVLRAFEGITLAASRDPAVERAMSLADVVKMVHQAFHDGVPEFFAIPDDRGLITRYLTLAYSPAFRRFVNRSLSRAAIWVYVRGDRPADLEKVLGRVRSQLHHQPIPRARVTLAGGDGATLLVTARGAWALAIGWAAAIAAASALLAFVSASGAGALALGGAIAAAVTGGALGWSGIPIDLVSLPAILGSGAAGAAFAAAIKVAQEPRLAALAAAFGAGAGGMLFVPHAAGRIAGAALLGTAAAGWLASPWWRDGARRLSPHLRAHSTPLN